MGEELQNLFNDAFSLNPDFSPDAKAWQAALTRALENCWMHDCGQAFVGDENTSHCLGCSQSIVIPTNTQKLRIIPYNDQILLHHMGTNPTLIEYQNQWFSELEIDKMRQFPSRASHIELKAGETFKIYIDKIHKFKKPIVINYMFKEGRLSSGKKIKVKLLENITVEYNNDRIWKVSQPKNLPFRISRHKGNFGLLAISGISRSHE